MREYGDKRDYKKIDIFVSGRYYATTTWAKNLLVARKKAAEILGIELSKVSAFYQ